MRSTGALRVLTEMPVLPPATAMPMSVPAPVKVLRPRFTTATWAMPTSQEGSAPAGRRSAGAFVRALGARPTGGFGLAAHLEVSMPQLDRETAESLVAQAHQVCRTPTPPAATCRSPSLSPDSRISPRRAAGAASSPRLRSGSSPMLDQGQGARPNWSLTAVDWGRARTSSGWRPRPVAPQNRRSS